MIPLKMTKSRNSGPSPAMLPRAQIAFSVTYAKGELSNFIKPVTAALFSTTAFVCSVVPETMLFKAQTDSNCNSGLKFNEIFKK